MAALSTILAITAIASSAFSAAESLSQKAPKVPVTPAAPDPAADAKRLEELLSRGKKKAPITAPDPGTMLTGPSGATAPATVQRQTLLGL